MSTTGNKDTADDDLVGALVTGLFSQQRSTTDRLVSALQAQLREVRAEVDAIRARVIEQITGDYAPTPKRLMVALYPSKTEIESYMPEDDF